MNKISIIMLIFIFVGLGFFFITTNSIDYLNKKYQDERRETAVNIIVEKYKNSPEFTWLCYSNNIKRLSDNIINEKHSHIYTLLDISWRICTWLINIGRVLMPIAILFSLYLFYQEGKEQEK